MSSGPHLNIRRAALQPAGHRLDIPDLDDHFSSTLPNIGLCCLLISVCELLNVYQSLCGIDVEKYAHMILLSVFKSLLGMYG